MLKNIYKNKCPSCGKKIPPFLGISGNHSLIFCSNMCMHTFRKAAVEYGKKLKV
jgi:endogenous inhibitor of DNA gyrase (YacG/DUF329 family)